MTDSVLSRSRQRRQRGMALATVLFLSIVLTLLAATILYSSNLETVSAFNYSASNHAFYAADAGIQMAENWFENNYKPVNHSVYAVNTTPVTMQGTTVAVDGIGNSTNYPDQATVTSFRSNLASKGLGSGTGGGRFSIRATLMSVRRASTITGTTELERWRVESLGQWTGGSTSSGGVSSAMVTAYIDQTFTPETNYAIFATGTVCNTMTFTGNSGTDSYNSAVANYNAQHASNGGDLGANGNISSTGSVTIGGNATVPGGAGGSCATSPAGGLTTAGNFTINGSVYTLQHQMSYDTPPTPTPWTPNLYAPNLGVLPSPLLPGNYGDISISSTTQLTLQGGQNGAANVYNINSLTMAGQAKVVINPPGPVIVNIVGQNQASPLTMAGGGVVNTGPPQNMLINYAGTGNIALVGGSDSGYVFYGPNATASLAGNSDYFGAIIAKSVSCAGGAKLHYDMALKNYFVHLNNFQQVSWTRQVK